MADPFIAEVRMMSFAFAPRGWAFCNGQLLPIAQNSALFSLLGTAFGGDGRTTFQLPDLKGRVPIHVSPSRPRGNNSGGEETHTLTKGEVPPHTHLLNATKAAGTTIAGPGNLLAAGTTTDPLYSPATNTTVMGPSSIVESGGNQAHPNMQPFLTVNFCIALQGLFPSQN